MFLRYGIGLYRCISTLKINDANSAYRSTTPYISHLSWYFPRTWDKVFSQGLDHLFTKEYVIAGVENNVVDIKHSKPINFDYNFADDTRDYGSLLGNITVATSVLRHEKLGGPDRERQVTHGTTTGDALYDGYQTYLYDVQSLDYYGRNVDVPRYINFPSVTDALGFPNTASYHSLSSGHRAPLTKWHQYADYITSVPSPQYLYNWTISGVTRPGSTSVLDIDAEFDDEVIAFEYRQRVRRYHTNSAYYTECTVTTSLRIELTPGFSWKPNSNISESTLTVPPLIGGKVTIIDSFSDWFRYDPTLPPPTYGGSWGYQEKTLTSTYLLRPVLIGKYPVVSSEIDVDRVVAQLRSEDDRILSLSDEFLSSAWVSASQAVATFEDVSGLNYIETLAELDSVVKLMPDTAPLEAFLNLLPRRKLLQGTLRLLDFASNTYLLTKFGLDPFVKDIRAFSSVYDRVTSDLVQRLTDVELRGKFTYQFDTGPLSGYSLTTRTTVHATFPSWSITAAVLPFSAFGLSPTVANWWDTVPFSFVIDWFTNLDDKIKFGESALHMLTAEVKYYVHSYKLVGPVPDRVPITPLDTSYVYYLRRKSAFFPYNQSKSSTDWLGKSSGVPMLIGGALLWTFLK